MTKNRRADPSIRSGKPRNHKKTKTNSLGGDGWIWGFHAAQAAIANKNRKIERIVASSNAAQNLKETPCSVEILKPHEIDSLLPQGAVHQGLAIKAYPFNPEPIEDFLDRSNNLEKCLIVVLDQVEDPHNVGAILRSAAAFGAIALVVQDRHAPQITGILAKAASGALEHVTIIRVTNLARVLEQIAENGFFRIGLAGEADTTLSEISPSPKTALILGAEGSGLRRLTREKCDVLAKLPTRAPISSLNVSNAAAVALYEISRVRKI